MLLSLKENGDPSAYEAGGSEFDPRQGLLFFFVASLYKITGRALGSVNNGAHVVLSLTK